MKGVVPLGNTERTILYGFSLFMLLTVALVSANFWYFINFYTLGINMLQLLACIVGAGALSYYMGLRGEHLVAVVVFSAVIFAGLIGYLSVFGRFLAPLFFLRLV